MKAIQAIILNERVAQIEKCAKDCADLAQELIHDGCQKDGIKRALLINEAEAIYRLAGSLLIATQRLASNDGYIAKYLAKPTTEKA